MSGVLRCDKISGCYMLSCCVYEQLVLSSDDFLKFHPSGGKKLTSDSNPRTN